MSSQTTTFPAETLAVVVNEQRSIYDQRWQDGGTPPRLITPEDLKTQGEPTETATFFNFLRNALGAPFPGFAIEISLDENGKPQPYLAISVYMVPPDFPRRAACFLTRLPTKDDYGTYRRWNSKWFRESLLIALTAYNEAATVARRMSERTTDEIADIGRLARQVSRGLDHD